MKRFTGLLSIIAILALVISCSDTELSLEPDVQQQGQAIVRSGNDGLPGLVMVKFAPGFNGEFQIEESAAGTTQMISGMNDFNKKAERIGITRMERVFPHAGKFEERSRRAGLHLWYAIEFDESIPVHRAMAELASVKEIAVVEPAVEAVRDNSSSNAFLPYTQGYPRPECDFTDPRLGEQWHYYNDGTVISTAVEGADARVLQGWEIETGKPEVIVCVVDGGIDITHEDLIPNLWINEAELNGTPGVDDDGNGYVDDIYGHNFIQGYSALLADTHGSHVAGTIAAKNNNNTGVAGVAGGDGTPGSGVRVMSAQIFATEKYWERSASSERIAAAIKYGADNGAVISQNSWGTKNATETSQVILEAIKYFIDNAGIDENGVQVGPMKGGLVIFAAGNEETSTRKYPAAEEIVVAVAAFGPDARKAYYSNWGDWVDISAPGGNLYLGTRAGVLSSIGGWDGRRIVSNAYDFFQGTSMACPHVSGVAALLVSRFGVGKPGLTPEDVKKMLYSTTYSIDAYNPDYAGLLGHGAVDAGAALRYSIQPENRPPVVEETIDDEVIEGLNRIRTINLADHFTDPDGDPLTFSTVCSREGIVEVSVSDGVLTYKTKAYGNTRVTITASDPSGEQVSTYFRVSCQMNASILPPVTGNKPGEMLPVAP